MVYNAKTDIKNEYEYLGSLISQGGGNASWAQNQMKSLDNFVANQASSNTSGATSTSSGSNNQTDNSLRSVASQLGYTVGYDNKTGQVNVANPTNNQSIYFASGQGSEYGLGGLNNNVNTVSDVSALIAALNKQQKLPPTVQPTGGGIDINALLNSIKQSTNVDYSAVYQQMLDAANAQRREGPPVLSWEEAQGRASAKLNPLYDQRMKNVMEATDTGLVKRGFYGQLPGEAIRQETAMTEENARAAAIANMTDSMVGQSQDKAVANEQMNMQREQMAMQQLMNALNYASSRNDANTSQLWNLVNYITGREDKSFDQDITSQTLSNTILNSANNREYMDNQTKLQQDKFTYDKEQDRLKAIAEANEKKEKENEWTRQGWVSSSIAQMKVLPTQQERNDWLWKNRDEILSQPDGQKIYDELLAYVYPKSGAAGGIVIK